MESLLRAHRDLPTYAVLYRHTGQKGNYGESLVTAPEEIMTRWEYGSQNSTGLLARTVQIEATVYVELSREEIPIGSILWKGKLTELPGSPSDLLEVAEYREIPDDRGLYATRSVLVKKFKDKLSLT